MLRVIDRISKKVEEQNGTAKTRVVDGWIDILRVCIQTDITNKK